MSPPDRQECLSYQGVGARIRLVEAQRFRTPLYYDIEISAHGTVRLPVSVCELLGLAEGDRLVVIRDPDGTRKLAPLRDQLLKTRGMFKHLAPPGRSMVDELIAERREEARREDEESLRSMSD